MPFNIEITDIILIIVVALIIFGPSKLPEISRGLGKGIVEFRNSIRGMSDGFREEMKPAGKNEVTYTTSFSQPDQTFPPDLVKGNYCTQCGAPNPIDSKYCNQCGQPILPVV